MGEIGLGQRGRKETGADPHLPGVRREKLGRGVGLKKNIVNRVSDVS